MQNLTCIFEVNVYIYIYVSGAMIELLVRDGRPACRSHRSGRTDVTSLRHIRVAHIRVDEDAL